MTFSRKRLELDTLKVVNGQNSELISPEYNLDNCIDLKQY